MRYTWIFFLCFVFSCNNDKKPAAGTDAKENDSLAVDPVMIPPDTLGNKKEPAVPLSITALPVSGNLGQITFSRHDSTFFYFDQVKNKGMIRLNNKDYILNRCSFNKLSHSYLLAGKEVRIRVQRAVFRNSKGKDCIYGRSKEAWIHMGPSMLNLQDIEIQDCPV